MEGNVDLRLHLKTFCWVLTANKNWWACKPKQQLQSRVHCKRFNNLEDRLLVTIDVSFWSLIRRNFQETADSYSSWYIQFTGYTLRVDVPSRRSSYLVTPNLALWLLLYFYMSGGGCDPVITASSLWWPAKGHSVMKSITPVFTVPFLIWRTISSIIFFIASNSPSQSTWRSWDKRWSFPRDANDWFSLFGEQWQLLTDNKRILIITFFSLYQGTEKASL